ncbi:MAG TPA: UDP-2,3-diacylglucosamine diphosphatase [Gemmatimonadota bacterium]|nr:UDP-2,3-diacylglucosamine diphosphatase [Gemmatimonadota bacterium]
MPEPPTLVASDAHLGATSGAAAGAFLAFLEAVPDLTDDLVLNGDVFDFWFEYRSVVRRDAFPALRRLAALRDAGVRVRLVGGNHDAWTGSFLGDELGIELIDGPVVTDVGGRRTYLAHGDGLAGGDLGYRFLKAVTRSRPARALFRWLHPDLADRLVRRVSRTPQDDAAARAREESRARLLSHHARGLLDEDPSLELVVFGHSHRPELTEVAPGRHYLNPGDWIRHFTYGEVSPQGIALRRWEEAPPV